MKNTGIPYENLTTMVFNEILNQDTVKTIDVQHNVTLQGKTTTHQIDVYWEFEIGGIPYRTIVQAKDWGSKVPQGALLQFKAVLDDLPGHKGVFVTKTGYQSGAIDVAKANHILLYELREPNDTDWEGKIQNLIFNLSIYIPEFSNIKIIEDKDWLKKESIRTGFKGNLTNSGSPEDIYIYDENKSPIMSIANLLRNDTVEFKMISVEEMTRNISFTEPTFFKVNSEILPFLKVNSVTFDFSISIGKEEIILKGRDLILCILKDTLGGTNVRFSKEGKILK